MPLKVAVIGAGSITFTREVFRDILCVDEFKDTEFAFTDISQRNLDMVYQLCSRDIEAAGLPARITPTLDRREALKDANYVFCVVRVGGLEGFQTDIDIPLRYGVDQAIGDTLAPGGIMYAQRTIPVLLEFCKDVSEVAAPDCLFVNYTNPMAMNTWAVDEYGHGVWNVGLCHSVQGDHRDISEALGLPHEEVDTVCAGINHQGWFISVKHKGEDLTGKVLGAFESDPKLREFERVRIDMMRRVGYFCSETSCHLSEYLPLYRKRPEDIENWISLRSPWGGETGGYLRVCVDGRNWFEKEFPRWLADNPQTFRPEDRGIEHASYIMEGLETGRIYRGNFNVRNRGSITNLPADAIVEVPCYVDRNGIDVPRIGDLPLACAAICNASISVQRLAVEAAVSGDDVLLRQAMLMDPLTAAVCNPPEIWQLVDEMLVGQEQWLPQYGQAIADAKRRLAAGGLIPARDYSGTKRHVQDAP